MNEKYFFIDKVHMPLEGLEPTSPSSTQLSREDEEVPWARTHWLNEKEMEN